MVRSECLSALVFDVRIGPQLHFLSNRRARPGRLSPLPAQLFLASRLRLGRRLAGGEDGWQDNVKQRCLAWKLLRYSKYFPRPTPIRGNEPKYS